MNSSANEVMPPQENEKIVMARAPKLYEVQDIAGALAARAAFDNDTVQYMPSDRPQPDEFDPTVVTNANRDQKVGEPVNTEPYIHPTYLFSFNEKMIVSHGALSANPTTQYNAVVIAVKKTLPFDYFTVRKGVLIDHTERFKAFKSFLSTSNVIGDQKIAKESLLPIDAAIEQLESKLSAINDPVWQALNQITSRHSQNIENLSELKKNVYGTFHLKILQKIYHDRRYEFIQGKVKTDTKMAN